MRLIDADALSKKLCKTTVFIKGGEIFQRMINEAPTIEPDGDLISRSRAIKDVSEWATDILHPDRLIKEDAIHILESLPSATSQNLTKPNKTSEDDLISRQDAIRKCCGEKCGCEREDCGYTESCFEVLRLERLPSAESTGAMDEAIQKYIEDGYMQPIGEDLISRQAAIDAMWKALYAYEEELEQKFIQDQDVDYADYPVSRMWVQNGHDVCHKAILSLPSAPDSRQRGEWVYGIDEETGVKDAYPWTCSVCNKKYPWQPNYCPNCGARMNGEDGEEE